MWAFSDEVSEFGEYGNAREQTFARMFTGTDPASCDEYDDGQGLPALVGSYKPNRYGMHDMHGNVWEWCMDTFVSNAHDTAAARGDIAAEILGAASRVYRGGSCSYRAVYARCANRNRDAPVYRNSVIGVRPARFPLSP